MAGWLRFLVVDGHNGKLMGLFGLGDPVFSLAPRDRWVGWDKEGRRARLRHVLDAFVLGAAPPYSFLLGGKLLALLAASGEVREAFRQKYAGRASCIGARTSDGSLALLTTTSALGRFLPVQPPALSGAPPVSAGGLHQGHRRPL